MTTTIAISPLGRQQETTGEVIQLELRVTNEDFFGVYDQLEVWRSKDAEYGPYEELTAAAVSHARIPKGAADPPPAAVTGPSAVLVGLSLEMLVNEEVSAVIVFTGSDPLTFAQAAQQISFQGVGKASAYVTAAGLLVVESMPAGTGASLRIVGGDAAPILGLSTEEPDSFATGRDARISLVDAQETYTFIDLRGSANYYYKIRFRNASTAAVSEFSLPHSVGSRIGIDRSNLVLGVLDLVQMNGKPLINQPVRVHAEFNGTIQAGKVMAGGDVIQRTDANGHVEFLLVRGQRVAVAVPGTPLVRTITVPTDSDVESFNLLDPDISDQDIFRVQVPELVAADRRTL